jgi:fused signal recognition particle receptor
MKTDRRVARTRGPLVHSKEEQQMYGIEDSMFGIAGTIPVVGQAFSGPVLWLVLAGVAIVLFVLLYAALREDTSQTEEPPQLEEGEKPTTDILEDREELEEEVQDYEDMSLKDVKRAKMARVRQKDGREKAGEATEKARREHRESAEPAVDVEEVEDVSEEDVSEEDVSEGEVEKEDQPEADVSDDKQPETEVSAEEDAEDREAAEPEDEEAVPPEEQEPKSFEKGLEKTREGLFDRLSSLFGGDELDESMVEDVEEVLFTADIGPRVAQDIIQALEERLDSDQKNDPGQVWGFIRKYTEDLLTSHEEKLDTSTAKPFVIMVVGVNGVGKTTTIGKMASRFRREGKSVLLVAGDTFRAAAVDQLKVWADRTELPMHAGEEGADPASVVYEGVERAIDEEFDVVICDTSGRLHTDKNLMDELSKMERVAGKAMEGAPHEVNLVLDANTGQNAIQQAEKFSEALDVTGFTLTKFDGTARGGVILGVCKRFDAPVRYIGIGERVVDLREFDAHEFTEALFM